MRQACIVMFLIVCGLTSDAEAATKQVSIGDMQYSPGTVTVKAGDTVVWTNADERDHTVTADDGSFKSDNLGNGDSFQHKFAKPGKYTYHCNYHPRMKGTVVVE